ncbi:MAG: ATP-binding cassette domain-containing protein, partial [Clostridia bacterium]|nr:ATP-binding cassette domain-containing protein [Clostridia bacterium]
SVRENMAFSLKTKKVPKDEIDKLVMEQAVKLELTDLLDRRIAQLSGGQRQRVALGRALVRDPQVFLLDEPLGNLDAKLRDQVRYELKKIQKELNVTTIYVTHDQTEAMTMADHIVLLNGGHIMQEGTPNDLYDHPANEFVAGFLGTPQINIFPCDVKQENGALILAADAFRLHVPESLKAPLTPYVGKRVDLGIRPSDFEMAKEGVNGVPACVDSIEPLGDAYLIYVRVGDKVVVFKYAGETAPAEKELLLTPNMAKLHLFDPQTQKRINP